MDRVSEYSYRGGHGKVSQDQGMREAKSAATTTVGTVKPLQGEKEILYVRLSTAAAVAQARLVQAPAIVANHQAVAVNATASIGAKVVTVLLGATAATKDQYANGLFVVASGAGSGYSYVIDNHLSAAASAVVELNLRDELEVAVSTLSITQLVADPYFNAIAMPAAGLTGKPLGVTLISAALGSYVWLGKKGRWMGYVESTAITVGQRVIPGCAAGTIQGCVESLDATANKPILGFGVATAAAANSYGLVDFKL